MDQTAMRLVIQKGPWARIRFNPFICGVNFNRKLLVKAWLTVLMVIDGTMKLGLSLQMKEGLH
jgi:hypothetical protein